MRGFGGGNMQQMLRQAQKAMGRVGQIQDELHTMKVEGTAGGGLVRVQATAAGEFESVHIAKEAIDPDDPEMLQDLILVAIRDAGAQADAVRKAKMEEVTGGLPIPPGMLG